MKTYVQILEENLDVVRAELSRLQAQLSDLHVKDSVRTAEHNILVSENRRLQRELDFANAEIALLRQPTATGAAEPTMPSGARMSVMAGIAPSAVPERAGGEDWLSVVNDLINECCTSPRDKARIRELRTKIVDALSRLRRK
jgi:hypothetical protein